MISDRVKRIRLSPTMKIAAKALDMKRNGTEILDFSVGEPDLPTPEHIKEAAEKALAQNQTKYTQNMGIVELRQAIARKLWQDNQLQYEIDQIIVTSGAKQSIFNAVMSLVNPGDEVIIPVPYYVSYPEMVSFAGGQCVYLETKETEKFKINPQDLEKSISPKTKVLMLNNPSNPSGSVYTKEELAGLTEVILSRDMYVISDEIYEKLIYGKNPFTSLPALDPSLMKRTVLVNGVSKAYAMTGWRIGYAAGSRELISAANIIQSHSTSNASTVSQYAALQALTGPQDEIVHMRIEFKNRRNFVFQELNNMPGVSCIKPEGAFYLFPNVSSFYGQKGRDKQINNSVDLADFILDEAKIAVVPGRAFGSDNHIRLSYSRSMNTLKEGMLRLREVLTKIK